jgi:hypothetical protein
MQTDECLVFKFSAVETHRRKHRLSRTSAAIRQPVLPA